MTSRIEQRRKELGMTQVELAKACDIAQSSIVNIETGKHIPAVDIALRIARVLGRTVEELFG